ncbi:hypothetical protein B0H12DRAFT_1230915 [Mycena haematopus]|nr:hypothetical protein B0H12DRAFT_1230915 [Mycena haematopus]
MRLSLILSLLGTILATRAADPDVFPSEFIVPQCTVLEVVWGQPPPIHLHVQPSNLINVTNLVDLGLQNGTSTTFPVTLQIGQNFTFAYNTIADQFTVFVCGAWNHKLSHRVDVSAQFFANIGAKRRSKSEFGVALIERIRLHTKAFPVGPVVGSVCALAVVILLALAIFLWYWRARSRKRLTLAAHTPNPHPITEGSAFLPAPASSTVVHSEMDVPQAQVPGSMLAPAYLGSQEHPKMRRFRLPSNSIASTPTTTTLSTATPTTMQPHGELHGDQPPAYVG